MALERLAKKLEVNKPVIDYTRTLTTFFALVVVVSIAGKHLLFTAVANPSIWLGWICMGQLMALTLWFYKICSGLTLSLMLDLIAPGDDAPLAARIAAIVLSFATTTGSGVIIGAAAYHAVA